MPLHKDSNNIIHDDMDGAAISLLPHDCVPISDAEAAALRASTPAQLWAGYQWQAQAALNKSDMVALRCVKAGVAFPAVWQTYTTALRAIVAAQSGTPGTLPVMPAYPSGA